MILAPLTLLTADSEDAVSEGWVFDFAPLGADVETTAEGFLRIPATIAVPGVMAYRERSGTKRELVPEAVLQDPDFLRSLENKPVVIEHPTGPNGLVLVDPSNIQDYRVGTVLAPVEYRDGAVRAILQIESQRGIDAVKGGIREVSPGYHRTLDLTPGTDPKYGRFDRTQTKRLAGNHVALTRAGRAGQGARLLLGDSSAVMIPSGDSMNPKILEILGLLGLDPKAYADDAAALAAIFDKLKSSSETEVEIEQVPAVVDQMIEAGPEAMDACGVKMDSKVASKVFDSLLGTVGKQAHVHALARKHGIDPAKKGLKALRREIVKKANPTLAADSMADAVVEAHCQLLGATKLAGDSATTVAAPRADAAGSTSGTKPTPPVQAKNPSRRVIDSWKKEE